MKKTFTEIQLERIANALEKLVEPQEEITLPSGIIVKPILTTKEEPLEAPEAEKEPKEEPLIKEEEAEKLPEEVAPLPVKEVSEEKPHEEPKVEEAPKEEPKVEPVKRAVLKHKKEVKRINPYRLKEEPRKGAVSGFRIKE